MTKQATNQKVLRDFCDVSKCPVWECIVREEKRLKGRAPLRRYCSENCQAYKLIQFLTVGNFEIRRKRGYTQYHKG